VPQGGGSLKIAPVAPKSSVNTPTTKGAIGVKAVSPNPTSITSKPVSKGPGANLGTAGSKSIVNNPPNKPVGILPKSGGKTGPTANEQAHKAASAIGAGAKTAGKPAAVPEVKAKTSTPPRLDTTLDAVLKKAAAPSKIPIPMTKQPPTSQAAS
jgi:hypothetical protein